ncbi:transglutaminase domain-containing protein [Alicyclobacillus sp. SO9]|uniref:transglutaminase domain-containing protein n=1 Tax=Alicyclobacillus sp. SO9 TaxID=2665646 RepID=UPI0018E8F7F6|nr:transglutaminase domain-containing protein [Alicyclobacillus sp. SO9]QQE77356.1 transglutaminase domain-containing protein [Alicyclobacillus sp. SO9]
MFDWFSLVAIVLVLWPIVHGLRRGFAAEAGYVVAQLVSIVAGLTAILAAWWASDKLGQTVLHAKAKQLPHWLAQLVQSWQQAPNIAHLIVFVLLYFVVSTIIQSLLRIFPTLTARLIPAVIGRSKSLGAVLGGAMGIARVLVLGALVYVVVQYFSIPAVTKAVQNSKPYQYLKQTVYKPWLNPLLNKELPVLANGALKPLTDNINLVAVPSINGGKEQGLLVVPKPISQLAKKITANDKTPRSKAYALYEWEIHHVSYNWKKYYDYVNKHKWDAQTPLQTLHTGKGVCSDYALLYAEMAHSVGLKVAIVEGIGGTPSENGPHAWNQVYLGKQKGWIPVDTTWGAVQDKWFDPPHFSRTHQTQRTIVISERKS